MNDSKRLLFVLLVILGLLGIAATVYFLFWKPTRAVIPAAPVPAVSDTLPDASAKPAPAPQAVAPSPVKPPAPDSPAEQERKAREALFRRARDFASRAGTYSNADGFDALAQAYPDASADVRVFLKAERTRLASEHPVRGPSFTQTTRALTARLAEDVEVRSATEVHVLVDGQVQVNANDSIATAVRRADLRFVRSGDAWIATRLSWEDPSIQ